MAVGSRYGFDHIQPGHWIMHGDDMFHVYKEVNPKVKGRFLWHAILYIPFYKLPKVYSPTFSDMYTATLYCKKVAYAYHYLEEAEGLRQRHSIKNTESDPWNTESPVPIDSPPPF
jgi:hypothetical protein